jgi:hypothetical protein
MIADPPQLIGTDAPPAANENQDSSSSWRRRRKATKKAGPTKPSHYKVICISAYTADLERLDAHVAELKRRGKTKMSRSELIRVAVAALDLDKVS